MCSPVAMMTVPSSETDLCAAVDEESLWGNVVQVPADAVFGLVAEYKKDPAEEKVDLVVGAYRCEEGKPFLLPSVSKAETRIAESKLDKEYLPIEGLKEFREASAALALGDQSQAIVDNRVMSIQSLSGTGALSLAAALYRGVLDKSTAVYISDPSWANHKGIFENAGFEVKTYRYWAAASRSLDFDGMVEDLKSMPIGSVVVLHLCAHNPTGVDPTQEQWAEIAKVVQQMRHRVIFDSAYQGYCTGDLDGDAFAARLFEENGMEFAITQSYSKNMGLYGERTGCLLQVCSTEGIAKAMFSQAKIHARVMYSNPPKHGARIATLLLTDEELNAQWRAELKAMSERITEMRHLLRSELIALETPGDWSHITSQLGMFSYTGISKAAVARMVSTHHIYMLGSGRISVAGLTKANVSRIAAAIKDSIEATS